METETKVMISIIAFIAIVWAICTVISLAIIPKDTDADGKKSLTTTSERLIYIPGIVLGVVLFVCGLVVTEVGGEILYILSAVG